MKRIFFLSFLCFGVVLNSCKYSNEYETVNAGNQFSVEVPSWMKQEELAPGAVFEYANRYRNLYAVGFSINKDTMKTTSETYWNNTLASLKSTLTQPVVTDSLAIEVNGMKGVRAEIMGFMDEEKIHFSEVLLEGKTKLYHISVWVRNDERKLRFKEDINRIIASIKEL